MEIQLTKKEIKVLLALIMVFMKNKVYSEWNYINKENSISLANKLRKALGLKHQEGEHAANN